MSFILTMDLCRPLPRSYSDGNPLLRNNFGCIMIHNLYLQDKFLITEWIMLSRPGKQSNIAKLHNLFKD